MIYFIVMIQTNLPPRLAADVTLGVIKPWDQSETTNSEWSTDVTAGESWHEDTSQ